MKTLKSRLPPLKSVMAFEAVARHLSVTKAAEEACVSREAMSRQLRILEEYLGVKLFDRLHRAMSLTKAGKDFQITINASLESIAEVSERIKKDVQPLKISIASTIAIASFWFTPRLIKYKSQFPEAEFRVAVSDQPFDMVADAIDIGFRYGQGNWSGLASIKLFDINSFPVCTAEYLKTAKPIRSASDLLDHALINLNGDFHSDEDWAWWLRGHGVPISSSFKTLDFDSYANVIQVALDSQGIAMGFSGLVTDLLANKKLVQPLNMSLSKNRAVYLVYPNGVVLSEQAENFIDWVLEDSALRNSRSNRPLPPTLI